MRLLLRAGVIPAVCILLGACAGKGLEPSPLPDFDPSARASISWRGSIGIPSSYTFSPSHAQGRVCAAGFDGHLTCFDDSNGQRLWSTREGVRFSGGVGVGENMVFVGTTKGEVLAYSLDGLRLWRTRLSSEVLSVPLGAGPVVVVRTGDSKVFGLDAKDGRQIWQYQSPPQSLILRSTPGMVVVGEDEIVGGFPGGRLTKLAIKDGALLWDVSIATPRGVNELERVADVAGTPLLAGDNICAVTYQGRIGCYESDKGGQVWARDASSASSVAADAGNIYYTESDGVVVALDGRTGASVWRQEKLLYRRVSGPVVMGDWIFVGDYQGYVHALSREDGSFVTRVATDGSGIEALPLRIRDRVLVQTLNGGLFVIRVDV